MKWHTFAGLSLALATALVRPASAQPETAPTSPSDDASARLARPLDGLIPSAPARRPDAPSGLLANVYSRTAVGLRWTRRDVPGERYEVRRDGESVALVDGTSHVASDLSPERTHLFEVIAVDRTGRRSPAARLSIGTANGSRTPQLLAGPATPDGLRAVAYSPTAGGLSWRRTDVPGLRYEVRRDGLVIANTDGTSHVDADLAEGRSYAYTVAAIDRSGRRSVEAHIALDIPESRRLRLEDVELPDPAASSVYARLGAARTVALARDWLAGPPFALLGAAQSVMERLESDFRETVPYPDEGKPHVLPCPDGGRVVARAGYPYLRLTFFDCGAAGLQLSGEGARFAYGRSRLLGTDGTVGFTYDALLVVDLDRGTSVLATGREERARHDLSGRSCRSAEPPATVSRELVDTIHVVDGLKTRYERYESVSSSGTGDSDVPDELEGSTCTAALAREYRTSARVTSPLTGGRSIGLRAGPSDGNLPLDVRFDDGTTVHLHRASGGADTLQLDVDGGGTTRSHILHDDN